MSKVVQPGATILVVDDDCGLLRLIEKSLRREGCSVATAVSGADAVTWLKENETDLALFDLKLQDMEAQGLIAAVAGLKRLPPFIIITGQGDERVAVEMMKSGALDYVVKDAQFHEILPAVVRRTLKQIEKEIKLAAAEEALRASEERFRVALKNSPVVVFTQDADLRYTWVHNFPVSGLDEEFLGKSDEDLFAVAEADRLVQLKTRVLISGSGLRQEVTWTLLGEARVYDLTIEPLRHTDGTVIGVTCAAMDITDRRRLENEVLQISESERRRIGQDLHDGICQHLAGIELKSEVLEQNLEKKLKPLAAQAGQIAAHVRDVIGQTRSLARGLAPVVLEAEGLMAALQELTEHTSKLFDLNCLFRCEVPVQVADLAVATHLYRIAQEAISNAAKHGKARQIEVSLALQGDRVFRAVKDNGTGFAPHAGPGKGMGLRIMQYRAGIIGGTLLIQKPPAGGAIVICFLAKP